MIYSDQEFIALVEAAADFVDYRAGRYFVKENSAPTTGGRLRLRDPTSLPPWAINLRRMFNVLASFEFHPEGSPLKKMCETGERLGWEELESAADPNLLALLSPGAKTGLKRELRRILQRATRSCLELEHKSYRLALAALGLQKMATDRQWVDRRFLGRYPSERFLAVFKQFPVLSRLWLQLIAQWRGQAAELLARLSADRAALSRTFFGGQPTGPIVVLRCGLSDPHNKGRTVTLVEFAAGSVIYKPRAGDGEWEWASFLQGINARAGHPKLKAARVLRRKGYCWMERIKPAPCLDEAAARRFFQRLGATIGVAHLLKAVDCHRDNIIAAGEHPVLVDAEALWHVNPGAKAQTPFELLYRTGFLPSSNPRSLQSRSSVLGGAMTGPHWPTVRGRPLKAAHYERQIVAGFGQAWRCLLGTRQKRATFVRRLRRIWSMTRRRIYWPTEKYEVILQASIQPGPLRSGIGRDLMLSRACSRATVRAAVVHAEITALKRLDIPYFVTKTTRRFLPDYTDAPPAELSGALRAALKRRSSPPPKG